MLDATLADAGLRKQALYEAADVRALARVFARRKPEDQVADVIARLETEADHLGGLDLGESPLP